MPSRHDYADGGAGVDTLYIDVDFINPWSHSATLKGFEIVKLDQEDTVLGSITSDLFDESLKELWQIGQYNSVLLAGGITAGFEGSTNVIGVNVEGKAGVAALDVQLKDVLTGAAINFDGAAVTTATVSGSLVDPAAATPVLVLTEGTALVEDLILNLSTDTELDLGGLATLVTIDGSGSTGALDINTAIGGLSGLVESIKTGSGDDIITVDAVTEYVEAGVGADVVDLTPSAAVSTEVVINEGDTGLLPGAIDSYTGFVTATMDPANFDVINFGLVEGNADTFLDIGNNGAGSGFVDALTNANTTFAAVADDDLHYVFSHNGVDGWLIVDADLDGTADYAVELLGIGAVGTEFLASNIIA